MVATVNRITKEGISWEGILEQKNQSRGSSQLVSSDVLQMARTRSKPGVGWNQVSRRNRKKAVLFRDSCEW